MWLESYELNYSCLYFRKIVLIKLVLKNIIILYILLFYLEFKQLYLEFVFYFGLIHYYLGFVCYIMLNYIIIVYLSCIPYF